MLNLVIIKQMLNKNQERKLFICKCVYKTTNTVSQSGMHNQLHGRGRFPLSTTMIAAAAASGETSCGRSLELFARLLGRLSGFGRQNSTPFMLVASHSITNMLRNI